jgi:transcriptional regulator with XRE-family HTH domain
MHIQLKRFAENIKLFLVDHFHDKGISQELVAEAAGVNQSTVSRWLTLESGLDTPLWAVLAWNEHPQLHPVAVALMDYLESHFGRQRGITLRVMKLNGSLHDEILSLMDKLGKLSKDELTHPDHIRELRRDLEAIKPILAQAEAELNGMEKL